MYQQPLHSQQTWSGAQFAQGPRPPTLSSWASAPVIPTIQNAAPTAAVPHPAPPHHSFVPPAPPGVNPQQWQNGKWMYTGPTAGMSSAQPHAPHPPPNLAGWNIPAVWGITPQYYYPSQVQKQPDRSYWDTLLTNNGLGLQNMHIKQQPPTSGEGKDKGPHTPWAWVPRELDDDDSPSQPAGSVAPYQNLQQSQQPSPVEPVGWPNGAAAPAAVGGTSYPGPGQVHHPPSHAYFSVPADQQQQQQHQQQPSATEMGSSMRPTLPAPAVFSTHVRQHSNNPPPISIATHYQQSAAAPGPQSATSLTSQPPPSAPPMQRSHTVAAPTPQRPGQPESYTSVRQLRPTFSPAIVRTPNHYRQDSHPVVPSPRVPTWDEANSSGSSAGVTTSANKHLSGAMHAVVPSPRVLPWSAHSRVNDGGSPTPASRHPRVSRTEPANMYGTSTRPSLSVQRSYSIPEPPRQPVSVSRQNSMPIVPGSDSDHHHHHHSQPSIADLPQFAEEPGSMTSLSPLVGTVSSESSESSTVLAGSPPPLIVPPRYSRSPTRSPRHRISRSPSSSSSCSSSSGSEDSDTGGHRRQRRYRSPTESHSRHRTYSGHSGHSSHSGHHHHHHGSHFGVPSAYPGGPGPIPGLHTPQGRSPASSTHTHRSSASSNPLPTPPQERRDPGFSLPPPQAPKPPRGTYRRAVRYGFWNRRGDYLTMDKYVVYAPQGRANPPELEGYPAPTDGYLDHHGTFVKYDPMRQELPESLPRQGQPPSLPYEKFVTYVYL